MLFQTRSRKIPVALMEVMMPRYFLHLRDFRGDLITDEEGAEFADLRAARDYAIIGMRELLADAIKSGAETPIEVIVVAEEDGGQLAAVPVAAALPAVLINALKHSAEAFPPDRFEEYRRNADGCRSMAERADDPEDKMSWLKLADAWLQMLPKHASGPDTSGWPKASETDSKTSH